MLKLWHYYFTSNTPCRVNILKFLIRNQNLMQVAKYTNPRRTAMLAVNMEILMPAAAAQTTAMKRVMMVGSFMVTYNSNPICCRRRLG